ncbi:MAG TPA: galactokinase [Acidimicrobiia bacterium]|nr:galactokinase [Acidimicrobiia bacterium]
MSLDRLVAEFTGRVGNRPDVIVRSPGRVNLIGDHTDYNDGFVLPIATSQAMWMAASPHPDRTIRIASLDHGEEFLDLDALEPTGTWGDYVAGTVTELEIEMEHGFDAVILSNLPTGAGLSSSAALEIGVARIVIELSRASWNPPQAASAAQRAENEFVGVPCGIMDQMIVAGAVSGHATLIDCRSLQTTLVPVPEDVTVVILDTGTRRRLVDSTYEDLRRVCEEAAETIGVAALRDARLDQVESSGLEEQQLRVARHVISENARTLEAAESLKRRDLVRLGELMDRSHIRLRDDLRVSGPELDTAVVSSHAAGCLGARMTGAGFAGCAIALVGSESVVSFIEEVSSSGSITAYPTSPASGVEVI